MPARTTEGAPRLRSHSMVAVRNAGRNSWRKPRTPRRTLAGPVTSRFVQPKGLSAVIDGTVMRDSFEWLRPYR